MGTPKIATTIGTSSNEHGRQCGRLITQLSKIPRRYCHADSVIPETTMNCFGILSAWSIFMRWCQHWRVDDYLFLQRLQDTLAMGKQVFFSLEDDLSTCKTTFIYRVFRKAARIRSIERILQDHQSCLRGYNGLLNFLLKAMTL